MMIGLKNIFIPAVLRLFYSIGMRVGEALSMRNQDLRNLDDLTCSSFFNLKFNDITL